MIYRVQMIQSDIDNGVAKSCARCPVRLATQRVPELSIYEVDNTHLFHPIAARPSIPLPRKVEAFIRRFDRGLPVSAITFDIEIKEAA